MIKLKNILIALALSTNFLYSQGLEGHIGIITGGMSIDSSFTVDDKNDRVESINSKPDNFTKTLVFPSLELDYNGVFVKTEFGKNMGAKAGYTWAEDSSIYALLTGFGFEQQLGEDFYYKVEKTKDDMYSNPYDTVVSRTEEEVDKIEAEVKISKILSVFALKYKFEDLDIDDQVNADAKQSGMEHDLELTAFVIPFSDNIFGGIGVNVGSGDFDGDSNDYEKLGYKYMMRMMFGSAKIMLELRKQSYSYDTANSYFEKIRDEEETSGFLMYMQDDFLGSKDMFLKTMLISSKRTSNIDFFEKSMVGAMVNIGYKF